MPSENETTQSGLPSSGSSQHTQNTTSTPAKATMTVVEGEGLDYRLRPSTFNIFAPKIREALDTYEGISINPSPWRPTTYAARLRDAITAFKRFDWPAPFTQAELLAADLVVRQNDLVVFLGPRRLRKGTASEPGIGSVYSPRFVGLPVEREVTFDEIKAFCILLSGKLIPGPVLFTKTQHKFFLELEPHYDISSSVDETGRVLLF